MSKEFESLVKKVDDIHLAVIGNSKLGVSGLIHRVETIERKERRRELKVMFFAGAFVGIFEGIKRLLAARE